MSLGKHKFYCEMCRKQCKDENAFQQHKRSSFHQQNMLSFNEDPDFFIERFSKDVQSKFCEITRIKYGHTYISAIKAYNEYIRDPYHTHLNSTRWATLSDFMSDLEEQGILEIQVKEVDSAGVEQQLLMIRMIDNKDYQANKDYALIKVNNTKESVADMERKREQKDLDKMIKQANKMQNQLKGVKLCNLEEVKSQSKTQTNIITFEAPTLQIVDNQANSEQVMIKQPVVVKAANNSIFGLNEKEDLSLLLKYKKSNLEKLLEHTGGMPQNNKRVNLMVKTEWVRAGLIVKIKNPQSQFDKGIKGEVTKVISADRVMIKIDNREREFKEKELAKVLPSEGGRIFIFSLQKIATIMSIDVKKQQVTAKSGANGEVFKVKFDDLCKVNL